MCITIDSFRVQSFSHAMHQVRALTGLPSIWDRDLQHVAAVRALAVAGRLDRLECLLAAARFHASKAGFVQAVAFIGLKVGEVASLRAEVKRLEAVHARVLPCVAVGVDDVHVLQEGWGRKGRAKVIIAAIQADRLDAAAVAERFQLAISTAKKYLCRARKAGHRLASAA